MINTETKAIEKIKHSRPGRSKDVFEVEPGDNTRYLNHALEIYNLPKLDRKDPEKVLQRTNDYFNICLKNDMKPTIAGYALALGISRVELFSIVNDRRNTPPAVLNTIKGAQALINAQMEDYMQNGKVNPASGIFLMKNNMGYKDEVETVISRGEDRRPLEELKEQAEMLPDPE